MGVEAHNGHKRGKKQLSCGAPQSVILRLKQLHISPMPRAGVVKYSVSEIFGDAGRSIHEYSRVSCFVLKHH